MSQDKTKHEQIRQDYPAAVRRETYRPGAAVSWPVPAETAVVLRITPR